MYGSSVARELIPIEASDDDAARSRFKMGGFISSANYSAKKTIMVLFINSEVVGPMWDTWSCDKRNDLNRALGFLFLELSRKLDFLLKSVWKVRQGRLTVILNRLFWTLLILL